MKKIFTFFIALSFCLFSADMLNAQNKNSFPDAEAAPYVNLSAGPVVQSAQAMWDIEFTWDLLASTLTNGNAAVCFTGTEYWVSRWASDTISVLDLSGNLVQKFSIGLIGVRSLTFDGTYVYAGVNTSVVQIIDPATYSVTATISTGVTNIRSLTFDPTADGGNGGFWASTWATDITLFNLAGASIGSIPAASHGLTAMYGTTFDNVSAGGPYLWVFDQGATAAGDSATIVQINIASQLQTGVLHNVNDDVGQQTGNSGIAGGIFLYSAPGVLQLIGVNQSTPANILFAYDIDATVGLSEIDGPKGFLNVNPSVVTGMFNINVEKNNNDVVTIQVINASGKIVLNKNTRGINNYLDGSKFSNGIYTVRVIYNGQSYTSRFVKM